MRRIQSGGFDFASREDYESEGREPAERAHRCHGGSFRIGHPGLGRAMAWGPGVTTLREKVSTVNQFPLWGAGDGDVNGTVMGFLEEASASSAVRAGKGRGGIASFPHSAAVPAAIDEIAAGGKPAEEGTRGYDWG